MFLLNFILDVVAVMLWMQWRALGFRRVVPYRDSLAHTLRTASPVRTRRWQYLAGLAALLLLRAPLYGALGPALHWVPLLDLRVIALPFRSDQPGRMLAFSLLSFLRLLSISYLWLILLSLIHPQPSTSPSSATHLRAYLGAVDAWPWPAKLLLPLPVIVVLWSGLHLVLVGLRIVPPVSSINLLLQQGVVLGFTAFLAWKPLVLGLLFLHVLNSYVHLGTSSSWAFINSSSKQLLRPLAPLPLRLNQVDFSPALGIILVWTTSEFAGRGLELLFRRLPLVGR
jgi:uncharacterized protein YggT (Ycf19 family)